MQLTRQQHLVLAGGGHAHVHVRMAFAMRPEPLLHLKVVSPHSYATYSGMVPGVLAFRDSLHHRSAAERRGARPDHLLSPWLAAPGCRLCSSRR